MNKIETVDELFVHQLQDLYSAEDQMLRALTKMVSAAGAPELRSGLIYHLDRTRDHLRRVEQALNLVGQAPTGETCHGIEGLITEAEKLIAATERGAVLDSALIDAARKVENYEITAYRSAIAKAHELGLADEASLLTLNLQDEELTDFRLQELAQGMMPYSGPGLDPRDDGSEVIVGTKSTDSFAGM